MNLPVRFFLYATIVIVLLWACGSRTTAQVIDNTYIVYRAAGSNTTVYWDSSQLISSFRAAWENNRADETRFQAYADTHSFHFRFRTRDSLLAISDSGAEALVAQGDRVELFFSADSSLRSYYCLEIAPNGRVLDYRASWYRQFDDNWGLEGLKVQTSHTATGYTVAGSIPLRFFQALVNSPVLTGKKIRFGLFRAETTPEKAGSYFSWYSWIQPVAAEPDFHIPSAFGTLIF